MKDSSGKGTAKYIVGPVKRFDQKNTMFKRPGWDPRFQGARERMCRVRHLTNKDGYSHEDLAFKEAVWYIEHNFAHGLTIHDSGMWNPQTVPECQFSLAYVMASAAYDGKVFLDSYIPQAMARQDVRDLMTRISASEDSSLPVLAARVNMVLKDGRKFSKECVYVKGHPKNPLTEQELIDKFKMCVPYSAYKLDDGVVDSVIKALLSLEEVDDVVSAILHPLTPE